MKRIFVGLFVVVTMAVIVVGCSESLPEPNQGKIILVERNTGGRSSPGVKLSCKSAVLDYGGRKIILEDVSWFGSWGGNEWLGEISIKENKLILQLPSDAEYRVFIGKQRHELSALIADK